MERLGEFLLTHLDGIAAYCEHAVRFGVVESVNATIKGRHPARPWHARRSLPGPQTEMGDRTADSQCPRLCGLCPWTAAAFVEGRAKGFSMHAPNARVGRPRCASSDPVVRFSDGATKFRDDLSKALLARRSSRFES
jgi:hypothetical protein